MNIETGNIIEVRKVHDYRDKPLLGRVFKVSEVNKQTRIVKTTKERPFDIGGYYEFDIDDIRKIEEE